MRSPIAYIIQFTIIGDEGVGKSCLQLQFTENKFPTVYEATNDIEYGTRTITVASKRIKLQIRDTAGKGVHKAVIRQYYSRVACIMLVYDITRRDTFNHIAIWLEEARTLSFADAVFVLIGNKCDMSNTCAVSYEEGQNFAKKHNLLFMEASAKTSQNVEEAFILTAQTICKKIEDGAICLKTSCNIGLLRCLPENITPSKSGGVAGSSFEGDFSAYLCCNTSPGVHLRWCLSRVGDFLIFLKLLLSSPVMYQDMYSNVMVTTYTFYSSNISRERKGDTQRCQEEYKEEEEAESIVKRAKK